ncbi:lipoyl synthase [bacterium]|nr:lipoyl synthase [candidate division CSSED10-310 bacterium]
MTHRRLPSWLTVRLGQGENYSHVRRVLFKRGLHTVCSSARCPNLGECWSSGTATFMIMGDVCTRNCRFCAVQHGDPSDIDPDETVKIVEAVKHLKLSYVVITSVTRDDLPDGGAENFANAIRALKHYNSSIQVEVLIPDFQGDTNALARVLETDPDVLNHNIETVPRLYSVARPQADYKRSLQILKQASCKLGFKRTKSGLMLGMGERRDELVAVMADLLESGVGRLTLGQYLQPTHNHLEIERFLPPSEFRELGQIARKLGFAYVASGPLVRSSYHAADMDAADNLNS